MQVICKYSSLSFQVEHFSARLDRGEIPHPIFYIPQHRLFSYLGKWSAQQFTPTDSYLLALALLNSTDLIEWNCPALRTPRTDTVIAQQMEALAKVASRISSVPAPARTFPRISISQDTRNLYSLGDWISLWNICYSDWEAGYKSTIAIHRIRNREQALERLIKSPGNRNPIAYARQLADWASQAGSFPTFATQNPFTGKPIPMHDYWKLIIIRAAGKDSLHTIPTKDIQELLEHCEDTIQNGGIFAHALFQYLKEAIKKQTDYFGFGAPYVISGAPAFLDSPSENAAFVEDQLRVGLEETAPLKEPQPQDYPTKFAYIKAKFKWDRAIKEGMRSAQEGMRSAAP